MRSDKQDIPTGMNEPDFLVESIPNIVHGESLVPPRPQNPWLAPVVPLILSITAGLLCFWTAGMSLGLFLGGFVLVGLLTAPLIAPEQTWLGRALVIAAIVHGIAGIWLFAMLRSNEGLGPWAACYLALAAWSIALGALTVLLRQVLRIGRVGSGAIVSLLALAWLTWPIWLSPALHGESGNRIVAWLVPAHPIFAMNTVLRERFGVWAEQGIAYNLTNLGDDITYSLPVNILRCVLIHAGIGMACVGITLLLYRRKRSE